MENQMFRHLCCGTIISERSILSAAHCFRNILGSVIKVVAGSNDLAFSGPNQQEVPIKNITIHPKHKNGSSYYDVAIITLQKALEFNDDISDICLPTRSNNDVDSQNGQSASITVWSKGDYSMNRPDSLRHEKATIFPQSYCNSSRKEMDAKGNIISSSDLVPQLFSSSVFCAGNTLNFQIKALHL